MLKWALKYVPRRLILVIEAPGAGCMFNLTDFVNQHLSSDGLGRSIAWQVEFDLPFPHKETLDALPDQTVECLRLHASGNVNNERQSKQLGL